MENSFVEKIKSCGIVGAGGAGFPTHVKVDATAEYVLINGAECEPLLRVDQQLMAIESHKLLHGLDLLVKETGAKEGIIGLKEKYHDAINLLQEGIKAYPNLRLHILKNFYPAGDEQVLVYEATGRIVPEGGIPLNVGVVVSNVETVLNIADAIDEEKPVTHKYLTLTGEVKTPKSVRVPIGITVKEALDLAGGTTCEDYVVINGGPMMGKIVTPEDYITKTTKALIVLPKDHSLVASLEKPITSMLREAKTSCMNCSLCTEVCPRAMLGHRLAPHKLMRLASYGSVCDESMTPMNAFLCVGCRLCEYACVMNLQPWKLNGQLKGILAQQGIKNTLHQQPEQVNPFRQYKRFPVNKLIARLGLQKYNVDAPMEFEEYDFTCVTLPLRQHVGAPAIPVVNPGDSVVEGQKVGAIKEGALGANIHASINGIVEEVTAERIVIRKK